mgnify:CR=1 FL=1
MRFLIEFDVRLEARHVRTIIEANDRDEAWEKLDQMVYEHTTEVLNNSGAEIEATDWEETSIVEVGEGFRL